MGGEGRERREGEGRGGEGRGGKGRKGWRGGGRDRYNIALCLATHTEGSTFTLIATSQDNITIRTWLAYVLASSHHKASEDT